MKRKISAILIAVLIIIAIPSCDKKDILSDKCEDIKLSEHQGYKLHYTWHTVIAEYERSQRLRKGK